MKTLSEQLAELSNRAQELQDRVEAAAEDGRSQIESRLETAKQEAETRREAFDASLKTMNAEAAAHWGGLKQKFNGQIGQIKQDIAERKDAVDLKRAQLKADRAEDNAEGAVYFALLSLVEAETAILSAIEARLQAVSLEQEKTAV